MNLFCWHSSCITNSQTFCKVFSSFRICSCSRKSTYPLKKIAVIACIGVRSQLLNKPSLARCSCSTTNLQSILHSKKWYFVAQWPRLCLTFLVVYKILLLSNNLTGLEHFKLCSRIILKIFERLASRKSLELCKNIV